MNRQNLLDRFYFKDNGFFYHDIGSVSARETDAVIDQRQLDLPLKRQTAAAHFETQTIHINLLQKAWSNRLMNLDRQSNHAARDIPRRQPDFLFSASSEHSAPSVIHGTSPPHEPPHHPLDK